MLVKLPLVQVPKVKFSVPVPRDWSAEVKPGKAKTCAFVRLVTVISCEKATALSGLVIVADTAVPLLLTEMPLMPLYAAILVWKLDNALLIPEKLEACVSRSVILRLIIFSRGTRRAFTIASTIWVVSRPDPIFSAFR